MNKLHYKRVGSLLALVALLGLAVMFVLMALNQHIQLFYTPSEIKAGKAPLDRLIRVGGLVVEKSVKRQSNTTKVLFAITDTAKVVNVHYQGILPDLFRDGQGVVVQGYLNQHQELEAKQVLAKHDENYRPPEVDYALSKAFKSKLNKQRAL